MIRLVRSELLKLLTTRTAWTMPLAMFLLGAVFVGITGGFMLWGKIQTPAGVISPVDAFDEATLARVIYTGGIQLGYLLAMVIGILAIGAEFRHKTLTGTLLAAPRRLQTLVAKAVAVAILVALNALAHVAGSFAAGATILSAKGLPILPDPSDMLGVFARIVLVLVLWGLVGLGLGSVITNQVVALFVGVAVAWIVEPLVAFGLGFVDWGSGVARWFPSQATSAALSVFSGADPGATQALGGPEDPLSWWVGSLTLLVYAVVLLGFGAAGLRRRDVL